VKAILILDFVLVVVAAPIDWWTSSFASFDDSIISTQIDPITTLNEGIKKVKQELQRFE
jgi:hypothetical protein